MTADDPRITMTTNSAGEIAPARLCDDPIVAQHMARLVELAEGVLTDVDQLALDLEANHLAIGSSVAWLVGDNGTEMQTAATLLRARLTWLAGQNLFPFVPDH